MKESYKNAMDKITVDESFEQQLKARLVREKARMDASSDTIRQKKYLRMTVAAATAAVIALTVISSRFAIPAVIQMGKTTTTETDAVTATQTSTGYNSISLAQDLSLRLTSNEEELIEYDANIFFKFEGFEQYDIMLRESCIVFNTSLSPSYTLANFFEDYYKLITNSSGISVIDNGILASIFDINDNGIQMISVYDEYREIIDLDTVLMSEYAGMDNVYFTISVT